MKKISFTMMLLAIFCFQVLLAKEEKLKSFPKEIKNESILEKNHLKDLSKKEDNVRSFAYYDFESIHILPFLGVGYRYQKNYNGYDLNLAVSPFIPMLFDSKQILLIHSLGASYHFYPRAKNMYLGLGGSTIGMGLAEGTFGPHVVLGTHFKTGSKQSFVQLKSNFMMKPDFNNYIFTPVVTLSYGISF